MLSLLGRGKISFKNLSLAFSLSPSGQIHFTGFALFIFMIYVKKLELIQVASMARYVRFEVTKLNEPDGRIFL